MNKPLLVGAVLYDPKVSIIWEIIADFFVKNDFPMDVVFYTNYELLTNALIHNHIDIAWNSPLAWLHCQHLTGSKCSAIAMRDTDQDRRSHIIVKNDGNIKTIQDLKEKIIAFGAKDSPQATLIPLQHLEDKGLVSGRDFTNKNFDLLVGKHGDHIGGELEAFKSLESGESQASTMLDLNWETWTKDGTISPSDYMILSSTNLFDHCVFAINDSFPKDIEEQWLKVLFSMNYDNPEHKKMMDMEGLKEWKKGRVSGFGPLSEAVDNFNFFKE